MHSNRQRVPFGYPSNREVLEKLIGQPMLLTAILNYLEVFWVRDLQALLLFDHHVSNARVWRVICRIFVFITNRNITFLVGIKFHTLLLV